MRQLKQDDLDAWIEEDSETIERRDRHLRNGWYKDRDLPLQVHYAGKADDYAGLGRSYCINNNPINEVQASFLEAANNVLKCFTMAYNINDRDYLGDNPKPKGQPNASYGQVSWSRVNEIKIIDGLNYSLMANSFTIAEQLAYWYKNLDEADQMPSNVNRYAFAYKYTILGKLAEAQALLQQTIDDCLQKKPTHPADINYFTLSMTLQGILIGSAKLFNEGLQMQLDFYAKSMTPADDAWGTAEEFFCDHAVALAKLALHHKLPVTVEHPLMPARLLSL